MTTNCRRWFQNSVFFEKNVVRISRQSPDRSVHIPAGVASVPVPTEHDWPIKFVQ